MEPVTIAIVGIVVFGVANAISIFIRQLLLSRDKRLNDTAQQRALKQETQLLEKLRKEMRDNQRFDSHYKVLGENKDAIQYLDQKIDELLNKKFYLIERYSQVAMKESSAIIGGEQPLHRKNMTDDLKQEVDNELAFYEQELKSLQQRRASLWQTHHDLQEYLLAQEKARNEQLDALYHRHSGILEKIYIRHNENSEVVAKSSIEAGTNSYQLLSDPIQSLLQFFGLSSRISSQRMAEERISRSRVREAENDLNYLPRGSDELIDKLFQLQEPASDLTS